MIPTSYTVAGSKLLPEMTSSEVAEAIDRKSLLLLPIASIETHGPHLPLATDAILGEELTRRLVMALDAIHVAAVGGPVIPFGNAPYFASYPGSISLTAATMTAVICELAEGFFRQGFLRQVLLTAHAGNDAVITVAGQALRDRNEGLDIVYLNWIVPSSANARDVCLSADPGAHAGESETARVLAARPELVHLGRAQPEATGDPAPAGAPALPFAAPGFLGGAVSHFVRDYHDSYPAGYGGDPTVATAATGDALYSYTVDWIIAALRRIGMIPPATG